MPSIRHSSMPLTIITGIRCTLVRTYTDSGLGSLSAIGCKIVMKLFYNYAMYAVFVLHDNEHC